MGSCSTVPSTRAGEGTADFTCVGPGAHKTKEGVCNSQRRRNKVVIEGAEIAREARRIFNYFINYS